LIKDFLDGNQYLETRLYMRHVTGWAGYSYEWQGNDAQLLSAGKTVDTGNFIHTFPSSSECNACHTSAANFSLGIEASQQNAEKLYPGAAQAVNQLDALHSAGFIADPIPASAISPMASLDDNTASIELRARSYLHSNCSGCHRPNSSAGFIDLRIQTPLADTDTCDVVPTQGNLGIPNARIIAPGDPSASVLLERIVTTGPNRMPPIASLIEDQEATALISTWISQLPNCL
jgi:mono/diheme cytochrome c family protein